MVYAGIGAGARAVAAGVGGASAATIAGAAAVAVPVAGLVELATHSDDVKVKPPPPSKAWTAWVDKQKEQEEEQGVGNVTEHMSHAPTKDHPGVHVADGHPSTPWYPPRPVDKRKAHEMDPGHSHKVKQTNHADDIAERNEEWEARDRRNSAPDKRPKTVRITHGKTTPTVVKTKPLSEAVRRGADRFQGNVDADAPSGTVERSVLPSQHNPFKRTSAPKRIAQMHESQWTKEWEEGWDRIHSTEEWMRTIEKQSLLAWIHTWRPSAVKLYAEMIRRASAVKDWRGNPLVGLGEYYKAANGLLSISMNAIGAPGRDQCLNVTEAMHGIKVVQRALMNKTSAMLRNAHLAAVNSLHHIHMDDQEARDAWDASRAAVYFGTDAALHYATGGLSSAVTMGAHLVTVATEVHRHVTMADVAQISLIMGGGRVYMSWDTQKMLHECLVGLNHMAAFEQWRWDQTAHGLREGSRASALGFTEAANAAYNSKFVKDYVWGPALGIDGAARGIMPAPALGATAAGVVMAKYAMRLAGYRTQAHTIERQNALNEGRMSPIEHRAGEVAMSAGPAVVATAIPLLMSSTWVGRGAVALGGFVGWYMDEYVFNDGVYTKAQGLKEREAATVVDGKPTAKQAKNIKLYEDVMSGAAGNMKQANDIAKRAIPAVAAAIGGGAGGLAGNMVARMGGGGGGGGWGARQGTLKAPKAPKAPKATKPKIARVGMLDQERRKRLRDLEKEARRANRWDERVDRADGVVSEHDEMMAILNKPRKFNHGPVEHRADAGRLGDALRQRENDHPVQRKDIAAAQARQRSHDTAAAAHYRRVTLLDNVPRPYGRDINEHNAGWRYFNEKLATADVDTRERWQRRMVRAQNDARLLHRRNVWGEVGEGSAFPYSVSMNAVRSLTGELPGADTYAQPGDVQEELASQRARAIDRDMATQHHVDLTARKAHRREREEDARTAYALTELRDSDINLSDVGVAALARDQRTAMDEDAMEYMREMRGGQINDRNAPRGWFRSRK